MHLNFLRDDCCRNSIIGLINIEAQVTARSSLHAPKRIVELVF